MWDVVGYHAACTSKISVPLFNASRSTLIRPKKRTYLYSLVVKLEITEITEEYIDYLIKTVLASTFIPMIGPHKCQ